MGILSREKELHLYGPKGIKKFVEFQLEITKSHVKFEIVFHELTSKESELIYEDDKVEIRTIPLHHRVYTNGYFFKEKPKPRKLNIEVIKRFDEIEICDYNNLKAGKDFMLSNGDVLKNEMLTLDPSEPLSYAYCSDTTYKPDIAPIIENSSLLYHESTFLSDREDLAVKTKHSTAKQAAEIAKLSNVDQLILGHYSNRYGDLSLFKTEAQEVFENVELAEAGKVFSV